MQQRGDEGMAQSQSAGVEPCVPPYGHCVRPWGRHSAFLGVTKVPTLLGCWEIKCNDTGECLGTHLLTIIDSLIGKELGANASSPLLPETPPPEIPTKSHTRNELPECSESHDNLMPSLSISQIKN